MPNSLLWIGLVVVWLFVLVPMLASKRPRIRQTSDAALATRVLHRGDRRRVQRGPAVGHRSDPDWQPEDNHGYHAEDLMDTHVEDEQQGDHVERAPVHEYIPNRRGRGGFDPQADALAREARYLFRQRMVLGLVFASLLFAALALIVSASVWWLAAAVSVSALCGYLSHLRRQVQIEQEIRRRRMQRLQRSRLGVESHTDDELRLVPSRLRRPGSIVLETDDEDPVFDHLDHFDDEVAYEYEWRRAAGE